MPTSAPAFPRSGTKRAWNDPAVQRVSELWIVRVETETEGSGRLGRQTWTNSRFDGSGFPTLKSSFGPHSIKAC
jgi:hypothetical protein